MKLGYSWSCVVFIVIQNRTKLKKIEKSLQKITKMYCSMITTEKYRSTSKLKISGKV